MDLSSLKLLIAPLLLQAFDQVLMPELQKLESQIGSEHLKVVADALIAALKSIGDSEIPKV